MTRTYMITIPGLPAATFTADTLPGALVQLAGAYARVAGVDARAIVELRDADGTLLATQTGSRFDMTEQGERLARATPRSEWQALARLADGAKRLHNGTLFGAEEERYG